MSLDRRNFQSSLRTIESARRTESIDLFDDGGGDSSLHDGGPSSRDSTLGKNARSPTSSSPTVSFSKLNELEINHLRTWKRRLRRTEVFDKYYFPHKWETKEMDSLILCFGLEDPALRCGGSSGRRRGSGNSKNGSSFTDQRSRRRGSKGSSGGDGNESSNSLEMLSSSLTSLTKLITAEKPEFDPARSTKLALDFIFFPFVHDPKSVLLKRGSVFQLGAQVTVERDLMIFTHGFITVDVVAEDALSMFLALSDGDEFSTQNSFLEFLASKFEEMDPEASGMIKKCHIQTLFSDLGIPKGETVIDEILHGKGEDVQWHKFHKTLQTIFIQSAESSQQRSGGGNDTVEEAGFKKKFLSAFQREKRVTTVQVASKFSSVSRVDSFNISSGRDSNSRDISRSIHAQTAFSVTLRDREDDPLIFVCRKPEHRESWVEALRPLVIRAVSKTSSQEMAELKSRLGWHDLVVRSTLNTHVVENNAEALLRACKQWDLSGSTSLKSELAVLDEHNGYAPLHYATILGHIECIVVLLQVGSNIEQPDRDGFTPMYHALSQRNDKIADLLEGYGVDRSDDLRKLIQFEIELQDETVLAEEKKQRSSMLSTVEDELSTGYNFESDDDDDGENLDELVLAAVSKFGS